MDILDYTAVELAGRIKKKEVSVKDAVMAVLDRIDKTENELNCYVTTK